MAARLDNRQEVAGSNPAPATKRGPGRPRKNPLPEEPETYGDESGATALPTIKSCTVTRRFQRNDSILAFVQIDADGAMLKVHNLIAAEDLPPGVQLETVPGMPILVRVKR